MKRLKVSVELYEELRRRAEERRMSISEFVSFLVQEVDKVYT
jgi:hypothetical protein